MILPLSWKLKNAAHVADAVGGFYEIKKNGSFGWMLLWHAPDEIVGGKKSTGGCPLFIRYDDAEFLKIAAQAHADYIGGGDAERR